MGCLTRYIIRPLQTLYRKVQGESLTKTSARFFAALDRSAQQSMSSFRRRSKSGPFISHNNLMHSRANKFLVVHTQCRTPSQELHEADFPTPRTKREAEQKLVTGNVNRDLRVAHLSQKQMAQHGPFLTLLLQITALPLLSTTAHRTCLMISFG